MRKSLPWSRRSQKTVGVRRNGITLALVTLLSLAGTGCSSLSNTQRGALIGAGAGGAVGAVVGNAAGSTSRGAIIGAVVGGAAGAIIGSRMNDRAETLEGELDNATIERIGEGILVTFDSGILFGFDSSTLRTQARNNLGDLASVLAEDSDDYEILVAGHTDSSGAEAYNQALSERRASAASDFLTTRGKSRTRRSASRASARWSPLPRTRPQRARRRTGGSRSRFSRAANTAMKRFGKHGTEQGPAYLAPAGSNRTTAVGEPSRLSMAT